jgi:hypothetical protein
MKQTQAKANQLQTDATILGANSSIDSEDAILMLRKIEIKHHHDLLLQNEKVKMSIELPATHTFTSTGGNGTTQ